MSGVTSKYIRRIIYSAAQLTELSFYFFCSLVHNCPLLKKVWHCCL